MLDKIRRNFYRLHGVKFKEVYKTTKVFEFWSYSDAYQCYSSGGPVPLNSKIEMLTLGNGKVFSLVINGGGEIAGVDMITKKADMLKNMELISKVGF